ncbi:alpha-L-fucosidase [Asinibacterium sp. OR53]|uniref:alpha-L-fucosidase n=1 Tax=Asinibacterium sp. OR53 TaxID=925409 RepID=UPI000685BFE7|nr:alpha-L-fucosidase [Asinibacterium sp. OR53]
MKHSKAGVATRALQLVLFLLLIAGGKLCIAQTMDEMWEKGTATKGQPNIQWFKDAKFGLFIHWGLYSQLAGKWNGKRYYGSGEWIMNQAKIPAAAYAKVAADFNPVQFNAEEWASLAKDAGVKYMVITAKHHEGFAMYDSKVSDFTIVKASPYRKDPMKALAAATGERGIKFGFYYSQFVDWHEPNGGRNTWDFDETKKNYQLYYRQKAIPQLKELLTGYGPLGIVWFDLPGGLSKEETRQLVDSLHTLQPQSLFSSRVGQGMGDYKDFGDSEVPPVPIQGAWESIYTHNDSWGYIEHDMNFKSSREIIRLLANVASKGGNLMLNVGPDGKGNIPYYSVKYLRETGKWLAKNGESIYATTYGFIPAQPWGVTTSKPGKLFLHVMNRPANGQLIIPVFPNEISKIYDLVTKQPLVFNKKAQELIVHLPLFNKETTNKVFVVEYKGKRPAYDTTASVVASQQYEENPVEAVFAKTNGNAQVKSLTYSHYFGDWKHAACVTGMQSAKDSILFKVNILDTGDYKIVLEYACPEESAKQEGVLSVNGADYFFRTLRSSGFDKSAPLMFIKHPVAITTIRRPGMYSIHLKPYQDGKELFKLKTILLEPVQ